MPSKYSYMDAIGAGFPNTQCYCPGATSVYDDIVYSQGDPIPEKSVLDAWITSKIKEDIWTNIQKERDRRKNAGVRVGSYWFHSDDTSRIQQLGLVMFGANMPPNIQWKTMSGAFVTMTPTLAVQIFQSVAAADMAIFGIAELKRAAVLVSTDLENFDYLSGWPPTYGE